MFEVHVRLWHLLHTTNGRKLFRYTMVSIISTLMTFAVLGLVFGLFRLWTEVPSTIFANLVVIVPNYYLNRNWVWGKTGRSHWRREVLPFWVLSVWGIALSIGTAVLARHISLASHLRHAAATAVLLTLTVTAFGLFWVLKYFIFNHLFRVAAASTADPAVPMRTPQPPARNGAHSASVSVSLSADPGDGFQSTRRSAIRPH